MAASSPPFARAPRQRRLALALLALGALVAGLLAGRGGDPATPAPVPRELRAAGLEALAYAPSRQAELTARAAAGLSHVLYAKSPGGATASARRTARWRPVVDRVAARHHVDPATLEALVLLESAGRPDARASNDLHGAAGLTQILAETGGNLLALKVDVAASTRLTRRLDRGVPPRAAARLRARRRQVDERFDPAKALEATGRYLDFARSRLGGRDDLAVAAYHMGVGNLQTALDRYGDRDVPYAQLFFDSSPLRHAAAWRTLAALGDDSSTYLWRIGAARDVLRLLRDDPGELLRLERLHVQADSGALVLHPPGRSTPTFDDASAARDALGAGTLVAVTRPDLAAHGLRQGGPPVADAGLRALRPEALAVLRLIGDGARAIGRTAPLTVTSSLVTEPTGWTFVLARSYRTPAQARALQFLLDRLTALDLVAWERHRDTLRVTVAARAVELLRR